LIRYCDRFCWRGLCCFDPPVFGNDPRFFFVNLKVFPRIAIRDRLCFDWNRLAPAIYGLVTLAPAALSGASRYNALAAGVAVIPRA